MNGIKIYLEDIFGDLFSYEEVEQIIEKRLRRKCMTDLCRKYYVDSINGSDTNDGLSENSAFASLFAIQ